MSSRRIFLYVCVSLIVVAVLVAGGYALYRLGVAHGVQGISSLTPERRFMPNFHRQMVPDLWNWRSFIGFPILISLPGVIFRFGLIAIAVLAIYGGIKLLQSAGRNGSQGSNPQPPQPSPPLEPPLSTE